MISRRIISPTRKPNPGPKITRVIGGPREPAPEPLAERDDAPAEAAERLWCGLAKRVETFRCNPATRTAYPSFTSNGRGAKTKRKKRIITGDVDGLPPVTDLTKRAARCRLLAAGLLTKG